VQAHKILLKEERSRLADRIVELSSEALSSDKTSSKNYIALKVGGGPHSNAATVRWRDDVVTFHIPSSDLVNRAIAAGFSPENEHSVRPFFKHKHRFCGLTLADLQEHESLFRAIVKDLTKYVVGWRQKGE
jgi:hypothetical protein